MVLLLVLSTDAAAVKYMHSEQIKRVVIAYRNTRSDRERRKRIQKDGCTCNRCACMHCTCVHMCVSKRERTLNRPSSFIGVTLFM